ncbi:hypothetical protein ACFSFW_15905 [Fredinandcohnia salidurans]|uniref:Uncharacterized protein n=1 Tax=Fredinandcohnia salidurans TaxID=2595041 RepID=A0ABW4MQ95_9BACI
MKVIDWLSDRVQTFTGEKDRRSIVEEMKFVHSAHKEVLTRKIEEINNFIQMFNQRIRSINMFRKNQVRKKVEALYSFLTVFGKLEGKSTFVDEERQEEVEIPAKEYEKVEDYIQEIDWSKDEVYKKTFLKSIFGARYETRKQNISMLDVLNQYKLGIKSIEKQADFKKERVSVDIEIAVLYQQNIEVIDEVIESKVIPEMELVEAMLEAESLKNYIIAKREIENIPMNKNISLLKGTMYEKHYHFIKNTFLFYIISKRIYNTPILTHLLQDNSSYKDLEELMEQKKILQEQQDELEKNRVQGA